MLIIQTQFKKHLRCPAPSGNYRKAGGFSQVAFSGLSLVHGHESFSLMQNSVIIWLFAIKGLQHDSFIIEMRRNALLSFLGKNLLSRSYLYFIALLPP